MATTKSNLTEGGVMRTVITFSLPYLLAYFLQTLYGMADLAIVGAYCGVEATTAVTIASQVMHMVTVMLIGLAMGTTVTVAQAVGARDEERVHYAVGNTLTLFLAVGVALAAVMVMLTDGIVSLMNTPQEAVQGTHDYLLISFLGIPAIVAYNILASLLRGLGDSRSPMCFIAIACVVNIALDLLFIGHMGMAAKGAAMATVMAQAVSVLTGVAWLWHRKSVPFEKRCMRWHGATMRSILQTGMPVAVQEGTIQVSFVVITIIANMRGLTDAAAVGIVERIIGALFLVPSSLLGAVSAICAQNVGAGKLQRAQRTMWCAMALTVAYGVACAVLFQFFSPAAMSLFTSDGDVTGSGTEYLRSYIMDVPTAGIHFVFSGFFCACGLSILSFVHNVSSALLVRIPLSWYLSVTFADTLYPMGLAAPAGSLFSMMLCIAFYLWWRRRALRGDILLK